MSITDDFADSKDKGGCPRANIVYLNFCSIPTRLSKDTASDGKHQMGRLVDHLNIEWRRFIVHAPSAVDELELPRFDQRPGQVSSVVRLLVPPAREEALLALVFSTGVIQ